MLDVRLLGPPRVTRDGAAVTFETRKAMALLALLALSELPRSREALCELLYPEQDPDKARGALRRTLSTLRTGIGAEALEAGARGIALRRDADCAVDVERFRILAGPDAGRQDLDAAVTLFPGPFLDGFALRDSATFDEWQLSQAATLDRELASALRRLVDHLVTRGDVERAISLVRRWLELDPLHEPAHRQLMRLLAWSDDRAAALEQYRTCVRVLSEELGVAPVAETAALFEEIFDGTLAPPASPPPSSDEDKPPVEAPAELPLVGRDREMAVAEEAIAAAPAVVVIEGEAGIGKTRLLREVVRRVRDDGGVALGARCHDDESGVPYGPVVDLLRQALRAGRPDWHKDVPDQVLSDAALLLPELAEVRDGLPAALPLEGPGATVRLLDGLVAVLGAAVSGERPGAIVIDDAQAADEATLDAIAYLSRRLDGQSLVLVVCWRSEAVPPGHRQRRLAQEDRARVVRPARLDESQVAELVSTTLDPDVASEVGGRVFTESEGLPLFVAEYLAALAAGDPAGDVLTDELRGLLDRRLAGLDDVARQVLGAAAAIGRSFDFDILRAASGRSDEESVDALEQLVACGVVRESERAEPRYDFSHSKLRELAYEQMAPARRRLRHGRIAAALCGPGRDHDEAAGLVAAHLRLAGDEAGAAEWHRVAAEHAVSVHAHADALEHLEAALALGHPDPAAAHARIGDLRTLTGDYTGALAGYEAAIAFGDPATRSEMEHRAGEVHQRRGEWDRAETRFALALELAPSDGDGLRARVLADLGLTAHHRGDTDRAVELAGKALSLAETFGDARAEAQAHNILGIVARESGDVASARDHLTRSLALADELGDGPARAAALNNLALVERDDRAFERAMELTARALTLCADYGDRHRQAALENNLADLHHAVGAEDEAMVHLKRAVALFSEIGADEATRQPEIWKLVSW
jgi:DNA-binding SARP family transcriptional activator/Tfp pilus assembly protein PilF